MAPHNAFRVIAVAVDENCDVATVISGVVIRVSLSFSHDGVDPFGLFNGVSRCRQPVGRDFEKSRPPGFRIKLLLAYTPGREQVVGHRQIFARVQIIIIRLAF